MLLAGAHHHVNVALNGEDVFLHVIEVLRLLGIAQAGQTEHETGHDLHYHDLHCLVAVLEVAGVPLIF